MPKLVIVESPAKAETIQKYLPDGFRVEASNGHIRDLPKNASEMPDDYSDKPWSNLGVNVDENFEPFYVVQEGRSKKKISELKQAMREADALYLATDEDREGEAISWHLTEVLEPSVTSERMVFHEITRSAIEQAIDETRDLDMNLVSAQEARRILDRLVGYPLSDLVRKKISYELSAGRVQSVAVRLLVDRERERRRFKIGTYWDLSADLTIEAGDFDADLQSVDGTRIASSQDFDETTGKIEEGKDVLLLDEEQATRLQEELVGREWTVADVSRRSYTNSPKPPYITSTLQQDASRKLGMSAGETMNRAQSMYENGFITYHRTDSTNLSGQAISAARRAAGGIFGSEYVSENPRNYTSKSKAAQEAHEAIRPTGDDFVHPDNSGLSGRDLKLYKLIWKRTVACQMAEAEKTSVRIDLTVDVDGKEVAFKANGNRVDFAGFIAAYIGETDDPEAALKDEDEILFTLDEGDDVECTEIEPIGHETQPPNRYSEASLVEELEDNGVGRPSTYATIIDKITRDDRYARQKGKTMIPSYNAFAVTELLEKHFAELVDVDFTARMEDDLDAIARGEASKVEYLHDFYRRKGAFADQIESGAEEIEPDEARTIHLTEFPGTLKVGRFGPYVVIEDDDEQKTVDVPEEDVPPADLDYDDVLTWLEEKEQGPEQLGTDPETGKPIYLMNGRYGYYLQLGEREDDGPKPKTGSIPDDVEPEDVDEKLARKLLSLPRVIGEHPEDGEEIISRIGRYGPYVKHNDNFRNLDDWRQIFEITLDEAVEKLGEPKGGRNNVIKKLGTDPDSGESIRVLDGRYGPYVKMGDTNASVPDDVDPGDVTRDKALELISDKRAR
jgi:DNA topoisomerase-1